MDNDVFDKYYKRVARRSWVKSTFIGLTIAFFAMLVSAILIFTLKADKLFYISFIVFAVFFAASVPLLYYLRFKPGRKEVASTVDALGMEERFVTMLELEGSRSFIAQKQRADTYLASQSVPAGAIKIAVSTLLVVLLIVSAVLGLGATTYTILAYADVAPGFGDVVDALTSDEQYVYYDVVYEEYDGEVYDNYYVGDGVINGDIVQTVREGEDCTTVYAEAMDDSIFYCWTDGYTEPERTDLNIREDMTVYAVFLLVDDDSGEGGGDGSDTGEGDGDSDSDSSAMGEEGSESNDGSGESDSGDGDSGGSGSDANSDNSDGDPSTGIGGGNVMNNNVYDNATDYENEVASATEDVNSNIDSGDYSDFEKMILGDYFGRINP